MLAERDVLERLVSGSTLLTAWLSDVLEAIRDGALDEPDEPIDLLVGLELADEAAGLSCIFSFGSLSGFSETAVFSAAAEAV